MYVIQFLVVYPTDYTYYKIINYINIMEFIEIIQIFVLFVYWMVQELSTFSYTCISLLANLPSLLILTCD